MQVACQLCSGATHTVEFGLNARQAFFNIVVTTSIEAVTLSNESFVVVDTAFQAQGPDDDTQNTRMWNILNHYRAHRPVAFRAATPRATSPKLGRPVNDGDASKSCPA